jgi:hypothetical protein
VHDQRCHAQNGQKKVGGCRGISASSQDVLEHCMNMVMIASVVPRE